MLRLLRACNDVGLILRERIFAVRTETLITWEYWRARARAWDAGSRMATQNKTGQPHDSIIKAIWSAHTIASREQENRRIKHLARKFHICIPDDWHEDVTTGPDREIRLLSFDGRAKAMRRIQKAASKRRQEIAVILTLIVGLIGSISGLLAVLTK